jgi:hypothetical protein
MNYKRILEENKINFDLENNADEETEEVLKEYKRIIEEK